ncbi:probable UDP-galactopyranose mutase [Mercenaria mercenaria]|uniref:probable UDP-galactopyranose mutase n=1 Tax=Mercenaria mercenaria TaxID=6596 RepID=UPI00234E67AF|nr:probable UDP-galactopyranose mutase [Mercenaria mercenaria]
MKISFHMLNTDFPSERFDICVVGAGLSGAVIAERYASTTNKTIAMLEKRNHIGGNCYDYTDIETGIRVSKYGAHLFHTKYDRVWSYIQQFGKWVPYELKVQALIQGKHVPVPVNIDTVNTLFNIRISNADEMKDWLQNVQIHYNRSPINFEEVILSRVGKVLHEYIFKPYTFKKWNKTPAELDPSMLGWIPVRTNWDNRYFTDPYQAVPKEGYTKMIENMLHSTLITLKLNTDYFKVSERMECGKTFFTGPIDRYHAKFGLDALEYRSLLFERKVIKNIKHFQPTLIVTHPSLAENFTRIVEYKWLDHEKYNSNDTVIFIERSTDIGETYYPVPNKKNEDLYKKYQAYTQLESNIHFLGRSAKYEYFDMDEAIKNALDTFYSVS